MPDFELAATQFDQIVSPAGAPLRYTRRVRGDVFTLTDDREIERLLAAGAVRPVVLIDEGESHDRDQEPQPAAAPIETRKPQPAAAPIEVPARTAPAAAWKAYGLARGLAPEKVDGMSRQELIEALT